MGGQRGASMVEYLLVVAAAALVVFGVAGRFVGGIAGGPGGALGAEPTTTTTAAVLGATAFQGGAGAVVWAPAGAGGTEPLLVTTRPGAGVALLDAGRRLLDEVGVEVVTGIDIRTAVDTGSGAGDLVVVGDGSSLRAFRLEAGAYRFESVGKPWAAGVEEVAGLCLHRPPEAGAAQVFVFDGDGRMIQWELSTPGGDLSARRLRSISFDGPVAACTVDDANRNLFVSEPARGLWRYPVAPGGPGTLVDRVGAGGGLVAGADALAVVEAPAGPGWILASSESDEAFSFYRRDAGNAPAGRFPAGSRVDRCHDVRSVHAAGGFLVCQGPDRTDLVPLADIIRLPSP